MMMNLKRLVALGLVACGVLSTPARGQDAAYSLWVTLGDSDQLVEVDPVTFNVIRRIKVDGQVVSDTVIESVGGFFAIYVGAFAAFMILAMMDGMDQVSAFGAVASAINNVGPGLGSVAMTFLNVSDQSKVMFAFAMLFGRLEIFTFLVLLTPAFWRR